jgi:ribosomal protein RSM22 (predicted rRNA methylase)
VKAIEELSTAFTTDRQNISKYLSDPRLISAYTAFYLTTNVPKLAAVMEWLTPDFRAEILKCELIDVGAGPGTFSVAWNELGGSDSVMLETSKLMREQAARLLPAAKFQLGKKEKPRLLLFGHSLNEMGVEAGLKYIAEADPDYVWMIEPGTKEVFQLSLEFRERMLKDGWMITYPCLGSGACPMKGSDDWCHQYVDVRHDEAVERLTQLAHKDRRMLPLTVFMFTRAHYQRKSSELARIVRTFAATKFSHEWQVCREEEGKLQLERFQLPFKSYPKAEHKIIAELKSGALIEFVTDKVTDQYRRISLVRR